MAKRSFINKGLLLLLVLAVTIQISAAQTSHDVGDSLGWTVPPGGASTYTTWASGKTFAAGDTLVFRFMSGRHDVAEVTKAAFDACDGSSPLFRSTSAPANVVLNKTGDHYFICTFNGHCNGGQKLQVRVSAASSSSPSPAPAPQRSSSAPAPTPTTAPSTSPAPAPAVGPVTYTVGDTRGWTILSGGAAGYQSWANGKSFKVGDVLVFNFANGTHNVAEITKQAYDSCDTSKTLSLATNPPVRITLTTPGQHYFTCTVPGHCNAGQKLAISVTGAASSPSSSQSPAPSPLESGSATPPSGGATAPSGFATPPSSSSVPSAESPAAGGGATTPSENSGASLRLGGLSAIVMATAAAFLIV